MVVVAVVRDIPMVVMVRLVVAAVVKVVLLALATHHQPVHHKVTVAVLVLIKVVVAVAVHLLQAEMVIIVLEARVVLAHLIVYQEVL